MQPSLPSSAMGHSFGEVPHHTPWSLDGSAATGWVGHTATALPQQSQHFPQQHQPGVASAAAPQNVVMMLSQMNGTSGAATWVPISHLQQQQQQQPPTRTSSGSASPHHFSQHGGFGSSTQHSPNGSGSPIGVSLMPPGGSAHPHHLHHQQHHQQQQQQQCLSDGYLVVVDPLSRKLKISLSDVTPTRAMSRSGIPSLCLLHMSGKCRQGSNCHQVHANERVVQQLRETAANQPVCCAIHGDVNEMQVRPAWKSLVFTIANIMIPVDHVAYTAGLKRLVDEHLTNMTLPASPQVSICVSGRVVSSGGIGAALPSGSPLCAGSPETPLGPQPQKDSASATAVGAAEWASSQALSSVGTTIPGVLSKLSLDGQTTEFSVLSKPPSMVDTAESDPLSTAVASAAAAALAMGCSPAASMPATQLTTISLAASSICRLHAEKGGCRYAEDCKFLHVCREVVRRDLKALMPPPPPPLPSTAATQPAAGSPPSHGWSNGGTFPTAVASSPTLPRVSGGAAASSGASSASPSPIHFLPAASLPAGTQPLWVSYAAGPGNVLVPHVSSAGGGSGGSAHGSATASPLVIVGNASSPLHFATPPQPHPLTSVAVGVQAHSTQQLPQHQPQYSTHQPLFQSFGSPQTLHPTVPHSLSSESSASPPPLPPLVPLHVFATPPHGSPHSAHAQVPSRRGSQSGAGAVFAPFVPAPNTTSSSARSSATASPRLDQPPSQPPNQQHLLQQQLSASASGAASATSAYWNQSQPQPHYATTMLSAAPASSAAATHVVYHTTTSPIPGHHHNNNNSTSSSSAAGIPPVVHVAFPNASTASAVGSNSLAAGGGIPSASFAGPSMNPSFNFSIGSNPVALPMDYFGNGSVTGVGTAGMSLRNPSTNVGRSSQSSSCCASPPMAGSPRDRGVIGPPSFGIGGVSASTSLQGGDVLATPEGDLLHSLEVLLRSGD